MKITLSKQQIDSLISSDWPIAPGSRKTLEIGPDSFDPATIFENAPPDEPEKLFKKFWPITASEIGREGRKFQKLVKRIDELEEQNERLELYLRKLELWRDAQPEHTRKGAPPDRKEAFEATSKVVVRNDPNDLERRIQMILETVKL